MGPDKVNDRHPFFRNSDNQTHAPVEGIVTGQIPTWLEGTLIRNGSGIFDVGKDHYNHMFDGLSVLHRFSIKDGEATYQNRALESEAYKQTKEAERIVVSQFGTKVFRDPCHTLFNRLKSTFVSLFSHTVEEMTDNCNIALGYYGDQLYAMTETSFIHRIDPETLQSLGRTNIQDYVAMNSASAHPHVLEDGTVLNIGNDFRKGKGLNYCFVKIPPTFNKDDESSYKNAKIIAEIPTRWKFNPCYYHSFGITSTGNIIFIESPLCLNIPRFVTSDLTMTPMANCMQWYPNEKALFYVVSMKDGAIHPVVYETEGFFTFHHINSYEENGHLVVDVAGYDSGETVRQLTMSLMNSPGAADGLKTASARRYVLPLNVSGEEKLGENLVELADTAATATLSNKSKPGAPIIDLTPHKLTKKWIEAPRINYKYNGKNYKYFYGFTAKNPGDKVLDEPDIITKTDASTGQELLWTKEDIIVSEPIFVANPTIENPDEDDGVILASLMHREEPKAMSLLILDAKTMSEIAMVKFNTDSTVPVTFHGVWSNKGAKVNAF